jgi:hypothetical protein
MRCAFANGLMVATSILAITPFAGCGNNPSTPITSHPNALVSDNRQAHAYQKPIFVGDGLPTSDLASVGIDQQRIEIAINKIRDGKFQNIHSILIARHGKLVLEEYFAGWTAAGGMSLLMHQCCTNSDPSPRVLCRH